METEIKEETKVDTRLYQFFGYGALGLKKKGRIFQLSEIKKDRELFENMKVGSTRHTKFKNVYVERIR